MKTKGAVVKEAANVMVLYEQAACERSEGSNSLVREYRKINTAWNMMVWFPLLSEDLETIRKCLGVEKVLKASEVISLFEKPFAPFRWDYQPIITISGALASVAEYDPKSFDSAIEQIATKFKEDRVEAIHLAVALDNGRRLRKDAIPERFL